MRLNLIYFLLFNFISLSQTSCNPQGHIGLSNDINESKRRNIFISEYEVRPNPYNVNDTLKIKVLKAWLECQWAYGKLDKETLIIEDKYQLVIQAEPQTLQNYGLTWTIGIDGDRYFRSCGRGCLMSDFDSLTQNIEEWKVQDNRGLDSFAKKNIIGKFMIFRKNTQ